MQGVASVCVWGGAQALPETVPLGVHLAKGPDRGKSFSDNFPLSPSRNLFLFTPLLQDAYQENVMGWSVLLTYRRVFCSFLVVRAFKAPLLWFYKASSNAVRVLSGYDNRASGQHQLIYNACSLTNKRHPSTPD